MRPLDGIRVIGLEQYMAGPYCTLLLADAGAEVIKIERPCSGDPRRAMPPFAEKDGNKKAAGFMAYNRNKKSLALNLHDDAGKEAFRRLCAAADVVIAPLVGFDGRGYWLGYGGGFFDRTLAALTNVRRAIGVGYSSAALASVHPQRHDIPTDHLVTEKGVTNHLAP